MMVFCYKIITESPVRSYNASPIRRDKTWDVPPTIANLINDEHLLGSIPEREWRLLSALLKKRNDDEAREKLANQFRDMWNKEKEVKQMVEAETSQQYRQFLDSKRQKENSWLQHKQYQRSMDQLMKESQIMDNIKYKERKSECLRANYNYRKKSNILDRAIELDARIFLAADRRHRSSEAEKCRKYMEWMDFKQRAEKADKKRRAILRDASKRIAANNALSFWESTQIRQEIDALDLARRAEYAINVALTEAKRIRLVKEKEKKMEQARRVADITSTLRDAVRSGRL